MARLKRVRRDGRAISPVIATVIIVAIAIAIAIAVAFWAVGLTGIFTRYEEVKLTSAYAEGESTLGFTVKMKLKNTGSADATLDDCFINGKPSDAFFTGCTVMADAASSIGGAGTGTYTLRSGKQVDVVIWLPIGAASSGQTLDIKMHTAAGRDYPRAVVLP
ncbi:MAG: archaellin/type IV pilin N-terminal domain-containing protein [Nitrososphaeria archaeon]